MPKNSYTYNSIAIALECIAENDTATENLYYTNGAGTPLYNGNISSLTWRAGNESTVRGYKFNYDGLDRITSAVYGEGIGIAGNPNRYSESIRAILSTVPLRDCSATGRLCREATDSLTI